MAADPLTRSAVDDLFNDDFSDFGDELFGDKPTLKDTRDDKAVLSPRAGAKRKLDDKENDGLGLDEEVKISKKRKPIAKLDEARLLSEPGIPKLRALSRSGQLLKKLRIKGKGHEFTDAARLLNHFQLWLDNLYPRAKFADALQLVEKAGHTKRMHVTRTEWINEGKPGYRNYGASGEDEARDGEPDLFSTAQAPGNVGNTTSTEQGTNTDQMDSIFGNGLDDDALFIPDANRPSHNTHADDEPDYDELDALMAAQDEVREPRHSSGQQQSRDESEGEDDLDALLAEQETRYTRPSTQARTSSGPINVEEDDLDALLAEQQVSSNQLGSLRETNASTITTQSVENSKPPQGISSDDDEDDLEALLAMQRTKSKAGGNNTPPEPSLPTPQPTSSPPRPTSSPARTADESIANTFPATKMFSSSPTPNNPEEVDFDDLDALLASQEAKTNARLQEEEEAEEVRTPRVNKVRQAMDNLLSSSPVPNEDSQ